MANSESRKLMVDVVARIDKLEKAMGRAASVTDKSMGQVEKRAKTMVVRVDQSFRDLASNFGKGLLAGLGAAGIGGITAAIANVTRSFADLGREAKTAGLGVEDFQKWRYVADQNRIGIDAMTDGFKELSLRADEYIATAGKSGSAAESFRRLGLSPAEVKERLKDPSKFMLELIDRTQRLKDTAAGVRIFDELFGGQGGEQFVRLIEQGRGGINATLAEASKMGAVFDANFIQRADEVDRKFQQLATSMSVGVKGAIVEAARSLEYFISSFNAMEEKTLSGLNAELSVLKTRKEQLQTEKGGTGDGVLKWIGKDAASQEVYVDDQISKIQAEIDKRGPIKLPAQIDPGPAYKPLAAPVTGGAKKTDADRAADKAEKKYERERKAVTDLIKELEFEAALVGKSALQKEQMTAVRRAGAAATEEEKTKIEAVVESTYRQNEALEKTKERMEELKDAGREFAGTLVSGLLEGKKASEVLSDAIGQLGQKLLNSGLDSLFGMGGGGGGLFGSLFSGLGGGGAFPSAPGVGLWSEGGYTGAGGKYEPAGVVHKGEYVMDAATVRKAGGPAAMDAMRRGLRGYADGGYVGAMPAMKAPRMPNLTMPGVTNNSSPSYAPVWNIDARGADVAAVARLEQIVARQNAEFSANVLQTMRTAKKTRNWI